MMMMMIMMINHFHLAYRIIDVHWLNFHDRS
jgi:hypothetical protein